MKGGMALPNIPELVAELTVPTYTFLGGQFVLEEKDQIKARLGRSPDLADALAETFAIPDMPGGMAGVGGKAESDADPYPQEVEGAFAAVGRTVSDGDPFA
jgi:hypothetical protein